MEPTFIACATCAKNFIDHNGNAAGWSILFLLGVILAVISTVAFCMIRLAMKSSAASDEELEDDFHTSHG